VSSIKLQYDSLKVMLCSYSCADNEASFFLWVPALFFSCRDKDGKEVISLFSSSLNSNKTFYTDANGREIL